MNAQISTVAWRIPFLLRRSAATTVCSHTLQRGRLAGESCRLSQCPAAAVTRARRTKLQRHLILVVDKGWEIAARVEKHFTSLFLDLDTLASSFTNTLLLNPNNC
jgi:hypothetical protein